MLQQPQEAHPEGGSLSTRGACGLPARAGMRCPRSPPLSGTQDPSNQRPWRRHGLASYRQGEGSCQRTHPGAWGQQESQREGESLPSGPRDSERTRVPPQERQLVRDTPALPAGPSLAAADLASGRFSLFSPGTGGILCPVSSKLCPEALAD